MALGGVRHLSDTVFAGERAVGDRHAAAVVLLFTLQTCTDWVLPFAGTGSRTHELVGWTEQAPIVSSTCLLGLNRWKLRLRHPSTISTSASLVCPPNIGWPIDLAGAVGLRACKPESAEPLSFAGMPQPFSPPELPPPPSCHRVKRGGLRCNNNPCLLTSAFAPAGCARST
jgi:hypothetical protein